MITTDLDYGALERLAYINGQTELAELYDKAAAFEAINLDEIKKHTYNQGFAAGETAASDAALVAEVQKLKGDLAQEKENFAELLQAFDYFLKWLGTDDAKKATNRKRRVETLVSWLRRWR